MLIGIIRLALLKILWEERAALAKALGQLPDIPGVAERSALVGYDHAIKTVQRYFDNI